MPIHALPVASVKAIVVFSGQTDFWWQRLLKPGYRHCGVIIETAGQWVVIEPLAVRLDVRILGHGKPEALIRMLRRRDLRAVETSVDLDAAPIGMPGLFTCVEAVKRTLGIRSIWVLTPGQLYKKVQKRKISLDIGTK